MHTAAPRPDIRTAMLLTGRVGPSSRAESGRGASTSRPGRCATIPRRAWHESSGDIGDTSDPEDPEARSRRLGFTTTSQLFKNAKKLERKTDKADKAEADLAMLDNLVDGNVESFEWFGGGGRNFGGCRPEPLPQSRHTRSQAGPAADRVPGHGRRADDVEVAGCRQVSLFYLSYRQFV